MKNDINKEKGSIVVEASFALPVFIIAMFFFINLINIFILHNKIQFAINAAAHEVAAYSYLYEKTDLRAAESKVQDDGKKYTEKVDETAENITEAIEKKNYASAKTAVNSAIDRIKNMKETLIGGGFIGAEGLAYYMKNRAGAAIYKEAVKKYISDDYLKVYGITDGYVGLSFDQSTYLNDDKKKIVDIMVSYEVNLTPFRLVLSIPGIKLTQRVTVPAWLDGDGRKKEEWRAE